MSTTKNDIIVLADELIRKKGYNAFSYTDIAEPLHIRNAAVHYYFPAKSDLGAAVVDAELDRIKAYRRKYADQPGDQQLKVLVHTFYNSSQLQLICLMGSLTPDYNTFDGPMQQKVQEMCVIVLEWITAFLEKARNEQRLSFSGTAEDRAALVISSLLSSLLLSRATKDRSLFQRMLDQLLQDMGANWRVADLAVLAARTKPEEL